MAKVRKPRPPLKPQLLTIDQWAEAKFKKSTKLGLKKGETLTDMVARICRALGANNPDEVTIDGVGYYASETYASTLPITDELQQRYNLYLIEHQKTLEMFNKKQAEYRNQLDTWKQQMISKLKAM